MAYLIYTLGLLGVDANSRKILTGIILIIAVLIPNINKQFIDDIKLRFLYANNKNIESLHLQYVSEAKKNRRRITELKKDASLSADEKTAKIKFYEDKTEALKKKYIQANASLRNELKADNLIAEKKI